MSSKDIIAAGIGFVPGSLKYIVGRGLAFSYVKGRSKGTSYVPFKDKRSYVPFRDRR